MGLSARDHSGRSQRADWSPPNIFSSVERFDFTNRTEHLKVCTIPSGPRGLAVFEFVSSGHVSVTTEEIRTALVLPTSGRLEVQVGGQRQTTVRGGFAAFGPIRRKTTTVAPVHNAFYRSLSIVAPQKYVANARQAKAKVLSPGMCFHSEDTTEIGSLVDFLEYMLSDFKSPCPLLTAPGAYAAAEALLAEYVARALSTGPPSAEPSTQHSNRTFNRAREYMAAHHQEPITVVEVARAAGTSVRALQSTFKAQTGKSPRQILTEIRLDHARAFLESGLPGTTVTHAAFEVGFCHLGRFSSAYQRAFGELPSTTLKRAQQLP
ncbi:AraC family transcriptional regulator [uncultured Maritimibacter sp.]|uniref:helix-turn-helix transcriptional regulator n=1 Tax=uncultured Maritimibacter sp. TaxID=991866 RepID=UPI0026CCF162|tara:strand:+ start:7808 stop:8770 length:963 start_codon:yes stop_codon:yes gene_type:complete